MLDDSVHSSVDNAGSEYFIIIAMLTLYNDAMKDYSHSMSYVVDYYEL